MKRSVKLIILTCLVCGYCLCLYTGITGKIPFLQLYSEGSLISSGGGYLWEFIGTLINFGMLPFVPDKYYVTNKNSKLVAILLVTPTFILLMISFFRS